MALGVVIWGSDRGEAWLHQRAWQARPGWVVAGTIGLALPGLPRLEAPPAGVVAVDVLDKIDAAQLVEVVEQGAAALLAPPWQEDPATLALLARSGRVRAASPWEHHAPLARALALLATGELGRASSIRLRSFLAGAGGWDPFLTPGFPGDPPRPRLEAFGLFLREVCTKVTVAAAALGPVAEVMVHAPRAAGARTALVAWRHREPGRQGALEITVAPGSILRAAAEPREDTVEITTSTGVTWVDGHAAMRQQAPLRIYRGSRWTEQAGLPVRWEETVREMVHAFAARVEAGAQMEVAEALSALGVARAAEQSRASGGRVAVEPMNPG